MLLSNILGLLAAIATATPIMDAVERSIDSINMELEDRETYFVPGNETDIAIWGESGNSIEARQVGYNCWTTGQRWDGSYDREVREACGFLYGGFATNQEKRRCVNSRSSNVYFYDFRIRNLVGGRGHEYAGCVDRLGAILRNCRQGGRVNRNNWDCYSDPNTGSC